MVPLALVLSLRLLPPGTPLRIVRVLRQLPHFVHQSLVGGIDVAWRALAPAMPIDPGWIAIRVDLPDGGRVALGGELSLMPGTLAAGTSGDMLLVHVLDRNSDAEAAIREEERRLRLAIGASGGKNPGA
ncbi:MAG: multicomponent Na+:H+ antiporter subunit MnhE [Erythrobacteraceae bacterium HL-111]|nr:MAG: multicomponent Na+:H+ antiporter subunit MnhE [Erythrobacteraceae bacterium HL-111]